MPLTTGYLASAGTLYTKETQGNKVVTLCAGALPDSADPVRFLSIYMKCFVCIKKSNLNTC